MIYMDTPKPCPWTSKKSKQAARNFPKGRLYAHLTADSLEELIKFGEAIGLKVEWLQDRYKPTFHHDIVGIMLTKCLANPNVIQLDDRVYIERIRDKAFRRNLANLITKNGWTTPKATAVTKLAGNPKPKRRQNKP